MAPDSEKLLDKLGVMDQQPVLDILFRFRRFPYLLRDFKDVLGYRFFHAYLLNITLDEVSLPKPIVLSIVSYVPHSPLTHILPAIQAVFTIKGRFL